MRSNPVKFKPQERGLLPLALPPWVRLAVSWRSQPYQRVLGPNGFSNPSNMRISLIGKIPKSPLRDTEIAFSLFDGLVKSHKSDGTVKSSICKARESIGMRRTYRYAAVT